MTEDVLERRIRELTALNTFSQNLSACLSLNQIIQSAIDGVVETTRPDLAMLFLREKDRLVLKNAGPENSEFIHEETPVHHVGECMCGLAVSRKKPIFSLNIHTDPRCTWDECKKAGLHSFIALPLRCGDHITGVLGLASAAERNFEEQAAFLETLSNQISIGLQNAMLHEEMKNHAAELKDRVMERTAQLEDKNRELERFNKLFVDRELRMVELKEEIKKLKERG